MAEQFDPYLKKEDHNSKVSSDDLDSKKGTTKKSEEQFDLLKWNFR
jgi:hypothetical protein